MIVVFDVEATGLPISDNTDWSTARLVQLAWIVVSEKTNTLVKEQSYLISDDSYSSSLEALSVHHISDELRNREGIDPISAIKEFLYDCARCKLILFHSGIYDMGVIYNECLIHDINIHIIDNVRTCNTKKSDVYTSNQPGSLSEVISKVDPDYKPPNGLQPHDALYDSYLCLRLYQLSTVKPTHKVRGDIDYINKVRNGMFKTQKCS